MAAEIRATSEKLCDATWLARSFLYETDLLCVAGRWPSARQLSDQALALFPTYTWLLGQRAVLEYQLGDGTQGREGLRSLAWQVLYTTGRFARSAAHATHRSCSKLLK